MNAIYVIEFWVGKNKDHLVRNGLYSRCYKTIDLAMQEIRSFVNGILDIAEVGDSILITPRPDSIHVDWKFDNGEVLSKAYVIKQLELVE